MPVTANELLTAIESGDLDAKPIKIGEAYAIGVQIDGREVCRIGCLLVERPVAKVTPDGRSIDVCPSPGMPDGFSIACDTHEDSAVIVEALDRCLEIAFLDFVNLDE